MMRVRELLEKLKTKYNGWQVHVLDLDGYQYDGSLVLDQYTDYALWNSWSAKVWNYNVYPADHHIDIYADVYVDRRPYVPIGTRSDNGLNADVCIIDEVLCSDLLPHEEKE